MNYRIHRSGTLQGKAINILSSWMTLEGARKAMELRQTIVLVDETKWIEDEKGNVIS